MTESPSGIPDLREECTGALDAFGLGLDLSAPEPIKILKADQNSTVLRVQALDGTERRPFIVKYKRAEDILASFALSARVEKMLAGEYASLAWSEAKENTTILPGRKRSKAGLPFVLSDQVAQSGLVGGCWSISDYIQNSPSFHWLDATPAWQPAHARAAGDLLARLHCAGHLASAKLTAGETHQLRSVLPGLPDSLAQSAVPSQLQLSAEEVRAAVGVLRTAVADLTTGENAAFLAEEEVIVHGDFHPGNVLFQETKAVAAIDFDYAHLEHPIYDLAYAMVMFAPYKAQNGCATALIEGYVSGYDRLAIDLPVLIKSTADSGVFNDGHFVKDSPFGQYFATAAALILLWTFSPGNSTHPEAGSVARRMIDLITGKTG